ncbi:MULTISPECIES: TorF family putative porin [unclassified Sphingomonas]|jgi:Bacterial protein of unknown function (Gcw_chp)|uniref:TorF family putative porin n=1 Tax=unclassified Sphingomonas TaxID=196159 RepID=UPI000E101883|nr:MULTISPECIES: TorF family putative porin [unclassified Sphingomonas]AXJ95510.1 hypothetical protein DM480_08245 [Sphingomonas sp. FARSPH]
MRHSLAIALLSLFAAAPAIAQTTTSIDVAAASDDRRRGLSWSDGALAPSVAVRATAGPFDAGARLTATRGSARFGGADAVGDLDLGYTLPLGGGVDLVGVGAAHLFAGARGRQDFVEGGADLDYLIGPLTLTGGARYAPRQSSIGGDILYLFARAEGGVPGTPISLHAQIGRTGGATDDAVAAARLRPGGDYTDWTIGGRHVRGRLSIGLDYVGTDIARDAARLSGGHAGDTLVGRVALRF